MTATSADTRPGALTTRGPVIVGLVLLATAVILLGQALAASDRPTHAVVWGGLALTAYAAGLLCVAGARYGTGLGLTGWRFGPWTLLWFAGAFGFATVTWSQPQTTGSTAQIALSSVLRALWLVAVGMTVWMLGYLVGPGQPTRNLAARAIRTLSRRFAAEVRSPAAPWILYVIGSLARVASAATSHRFGYVGDAASAVSTATAYQQILAVLSLCPPLAVAAAGLQVFRQRSQGARVTLLVLFLTELIVGAAAGMRGNFVIAVLAVAIPYSAARNRLPKAALVVATLAFLVVVSPFTAAYRDSARGGPATLTSTQAIDEAPGTLRQTVASHNMAAALPGSVDYLLQRIREIDSPAMILQRTPGQIAFRSPGELVEAPIADIVPRAIWPGKPIVDPGYQLNQQYYGLPATTYTSSAITPIGDLYRHGGWIPVVAGMFVLGCGWRLLDDVLDVRMNPHAIFLVVLLFPMLVESENDWAGILAGIPATIFIWLLAVALTFRVRR